MRRAAPDQVDSASVVVRQIGQSGSRATGGCIARPRGPKNTFTADRRCLISSPGGVLGNGWHAPEGEGEGGLLEGLLLDACPDIFTETVNRLARQL